MLESFLLKTFLSILLKFLEEDRFFILKIWTVKKLVNGCFSSILIADKNSVS